jgi:hypothetical protein
MTLFVDNGAPAEDELGSRLLRRRELGRARMQKLRENMPPEQRDQLRARDRERMKIARQNATAEQRAKERERERNRPPRKLTPEQCERRRQRSRNRLRPFWAVDGEGAGTDDKGRQPYVLMVASGSGADENRVVHRDGAPLSVRDCLEFLLSLPPEPILVGYGFNYDANQIIRGIGKVATLKRILNPLQGQYGPRSTFWGDYAITYQKGQYFRVSRVDRRGPKPVVDKSTTRTIREVLGSFQSSFVSTITKFTVGSEQERAFVPKNKAQREEFDGLTAEMIDYCKLECRLLASLMTDFRADCIERDSVPAQWSGAGWIAASLLKKHGIPKRPLTANEAALLAATTGSPCDSQLRRPERDPEFEAAASLAFYGGRSEVSRIGLIPGPVYEYDLNSAYPASMCDLPCPMHTRWVHRPHARRLPKAGLYLAKVTFTHEFIQPWCGLPFRRKARLCWPYQGTGWYWSCEIEAARRYLFANISVRDLWVAERACDCRLYDWVPALYEERKRLGSDTRGYPLKLGLNSLYGKMAQRSGRGPYHDAVAAGLITAMTRARLIEAVGYDPEAVVMLATDAVYSTRPLPLDIGEGLGQWEQKTWPDLFIAQPGVYWSPSELAAGTGPDKVTVKSRGAPRSVIGDAAPQFQRTFEDWIAKLRQADDLAVMLRNRKRIPTVPVSVRVFHACALALARHKPSLAGTWKDVTRLLRFDWSGKRHSIQGVELAGDSLLTMPITQSKLDESEGYKPVDFDKAIEIVGEDGRTVTISEDTLFEAQPDFVQWLPHE